MDNLGDPTGWTDREREFFAAGWNECLKMQPGKIEAMGQAIRQHRCPVDSAMTVAKCVDGKWCGCSNGLLLVATAQQSVGKP